MAAPVGEKMVEQASNSTIKRFYEQTVSFGGYVIMHPCKAAGGALDKVVALTSVLDNVVPGGQLGIGIFATGASGGSTIFCAKKFLYELGQLRIGIEPKKSATIAWGVATLASGALSAFSGRVAHAGLDVGKVFLNALAQRAPVTSLGVGFIGTVAGGRATILCGQRFYKELRDPKGTWKATAGWGAATAASAAFTAASATLAYSGFQSLWSGWKSSTSSAPANNTASNHTALNDSLSVNGSKDCTLSKEFQELNNGSRSNEITELPVLELNNGTQANETAALPVPDLNNESFVPEVESMPVQLQQNDTGEEVCWLEDQPPA